MDSASADNRSKSLFKRNEIDFGAVHYAPTVSQSSNENVMSQQKFCRLEKYFRGKQTSIMLRHLTY